MITGPYITKPVTVPEHVEQVLDLDAYWNLGFDGEPLDDGEPTLLYARVAFPSLAAAQSQFRLERDARRARNAKPARQARPRRRRQPGTSGRPDNPAPPA
jgi:hypothetical protein